MPWILWNWTWISCNWTWISCNWTWILCNFPINNLIIMFQSPKTLGGCIKMSKLFIIFIAFALVLVFPCISEILSARIPLFLWSPSTFWKTNMVISTFNFKISILKVSISKEIDFHTYVIIIFWIYTSCIVSLKMWLFVVVQEILDIIYYVINYK